MTITTPALLFSAISLLMLAYTNKFLTLAQIVRQLVSTSSGVRSEHIDGQIKNLKLRLNLIKYMQGCGALSFLFCTLSMFSLFLEYMVIGEILFGLGLLLLGTSLLILFYEVTISTNALKLELEHIS